MVSLKHAKKIYILGPSASGKSTLARQLASELDIESICTDQLLFYDDGTGTKKLSLEELDEKVTRVLGNHTSWILDGKYVHSTILDEADVIICTHLSLVRCLLNQWKRFFLSKAQRKKYGLTRNLILTRRLFLQHLGLFQEGNDYNESTFYTYTKVKKMLAPHQDKVLWIRHTQEFSTLLSALKNP